MRELQFLREFINDCNKSNSTLDKQKVMKTYYDKNPVMFETVMKLVFDYHNKYYVTSEQVSKLQLVLTNYEEYEYLLEDYAEISELCELLSSRKVTGHNAVAQIIKFLHLNSGYENEIFKVLDKDLGCRIDAKTINKVVPNLIPTFNVSLGEKVDWNRFDWETSDWYISRKIDGCLHYDTSVLLSDGSYKTIGEIVENKLDVEVVSYNEISKKFENKKISNYMKNGVENNELKYNWFEIELENGTKIKLTGNHKVYLPELNCYRRVDELKGDENILYTI